MLKRATLFLALVVLAAGSLTSASSPAMKFDLAAEENAIRALDMQYTQAIMSHDMNRLRPLLADDMVSLTHHPNRPRVDGIQDVVSLTNLYFSETPNLTIVTQPERIVIAQSADLAYLLGSYQARFDSPSGPRVDTGRYLFVMRKIGGAWKVAIHGGVAGIWDPPSKWTNPPQKGTKK